MEPRTESCAQWINRHRRRVLANVGFTLKEAAASEHEHSGEVAPERHADEYVGCVFPQVHPEDDLEDQAQDRRHGDGVQQRPAEAEHRAAVARTQIHLDQR